MYTRGALAGLPPWGHCAVAWAGQPASLTSSRLRPSSLCADTQLSLRVARQYLAE